MHGLAARVARFVYFDLAPNYAREAPSTKSTAAATRLARNTFNRAQQTYRLRFLTEKYGLTTDSWVSDAVDDE